MEEPTKTNKEVSTKEIGAYFKKDEEGFLINPASPEKIGSDWKPVVDDIVSAYRSHYGDRLHSVYVRGSVAKGDAVLNISDVDTFAYVDLPKDQINTEWSECFEKELEKKYPFAQGFEISVDPVEKASKDRILLLQSACVFGTDLSKKMSKVRVGKETLGHVYGFKKDIAWFDEWASKPQGKEEIMNSRTWFMKRFLRTGLELTMERAGLYTRDLYPSYKAFAEYYPEKDSEMKEILYLALNPTDNVEVMRKVRQNSGVWLEQQASEFKS